MKQKAMGEKRLSPHDDELEFSVVRASETDRGPLTALLCEAFFGMMKAISKDRQALEALFSPFIRPERFWTAKTKDGRVIGMAALSLQGEPALAVEEAHVRRSFRWPRGFIAGKFLKKEFDRGGLEAGLGYIECVATDEAFRRNGAAEAILKRLMAEADCTLFRLDVIEGNEAVLALYEKLGFAVKAKERESFPCLKGYRFRYVLERPKKI